jgi:TRAP-type C4-dicarboxylate transport system substrate-binding protein
MSEVEILSSTQHTDHSKRKEVCKAYYERNADKLKQKAAEYYLANKDRYKKRYEERREELKEYNREYQRSHRETINQTQKAYRERVKARKASQASS